VSKVIFYFSSGYCPETIEFISKDYAFMLKVFPKTIYIVFPVLILNELSNFSWVNIPKNVVKGKLKQGFL
jgi:hypothetical protein